jgi:hypothetical protein
MALNVAIQVAPDLPGQSGSGFTEFAGDSSTSGHARRLVDPHRDAVLVVADRAPKDAFVDPRGDGLDCRQHHGAAALRAGGVSNERGALRECHCRDLDSIA